MLRINTVLFFLLVMIAFLSSCTQYDRKPAEKPAVKSADPIHDYHGQPISELDKRLLLTDSLAFIFYKDPYGKDSLRYSRYYTQYNTKDTMHVSALLSSLQFDSQRFEKKKPCRNEGKIWCFSQGDIVQTIYFSLLQPGCYHAFIIINGQFYYTPMQAGMEQMIQALKPLSVEVANDGMAD